MGIDPYSIPGGDFGIVVGNDRNLKSTKAEKCLGA